MYTKKYRTFHELKPQFHFLCYLLNPGIQGLGNQLQEIRLTTKRGRVFSALALELWNLLPGEIQQESSLPTYAKCTLAWFIFSFAFGKEEIFFILFFEGQAIFRHMLYIWL